MTNLGPSAEALLRQGPRRLAYTGHVRLAVGRRPEAGYVVIALVMAAAAVAPWITRPDFRINPLGAPDSLAVSLASLACLIAFGAAALNDWREVEVLALGGGARVRRALRCRTIDGDALVGAQVQAASARGGVRFSIRLDLADGGAECVDVFDAPQGAAWAGAWLERANAALRELGYGRV